jgi:putative transposase
MWGGNDMNPMGFKTGQRMLISGREHIVDGILNDGSLRLMDAATNTCMKRQVKNLLDIYSRGGLRLLQDTQAEFFAIRKMGTLREADISALSDKEKEQLKRRYEYVSRIKKEKVILTTNEFGQLVKEISHEINDPNPPSGVQLYRWFSDYNKSAGNVRALIPMFNRRGNTKSHFTQEELNLMDGIIRERYLNQPRTSVKVVYEAVVGEFGRQNKLRAENKLKIPSYWLVYRAIKKLDPYEVMRSRYGKLAADRQFKPQQQGPEPSHPLERVEIDHTKLDLFIVDGERRMPIGRPWLTSAIDVYSKCVLGFYISFNPPSYLSVMKCLQNAIMPKNYVEEEFKAINQKWNTYGLVGTLVVDNGKEFWSNDLEDACLQLGIVIQYAPVKLAWYKGTVERYFRTLNMSLLHNQPGTTFSNIFDKADYDPMKNATIDMPTLQLIVHKWVIDVYNREPHKGLKSLPYLIWEKGIEIYPPAMPASVEDLRVMTGMTAVRTITRSGIEFKGIFYNDDNLNKFRRQNQADGKVKIKYDPEDLSLVYVIDTLTKKFFAVRAVNQKYTSGLTLWQHDVITKHVREHIKANFDMVDLCIAKEEIQRIVEDAWHRTGKSETRVKMARWLSSDSRGVLEREKPRVADQDSTELQRQGDQFMIEMLKRESGLNKGISDLPQTTIIKAETGNETNVSSVGKEDTMTIEAIKQKGKKKVGASRKKGQKNKKTEDVQNPAAVKAKEDPSEKLDLTGWELGYVKR